MATFLSRFRLEIDKVFVSIDAGFAKRVRI